MWKEAADRERNLRIFKEELDSFLPKAILDFHVHVFPEGAIPAGSTFSCAGHPLAEYSMEALEADLEAVYPGRLTRAVCFGLPLAGYDRRRMNDYVARECDRKRFFAVRLFDAIEDRPDGLRQELEGGAYLGIKPYPDYVRKADLASVEIPEMLPAWAMEIADALGLLVILHLPRRGRLADTLNLRHVAELCDRYPRARIVLAHIGRAYFLKGIVGAIEQLKDLPNLYVDTAMVQNWEVLEHCFKVFDGRKILYGTDIPIALAPGKAVEINDQYTYVTPVPWELSVSDDRGRLVFTSFLYEELRAIAKAVGRAGLSRGWVEGFFNGNALDLIAGVSRPR